jgi:hypothetical protein
MLCKKLQHAINWLEKIIFGIKNPKPIIEQVKYAVSKWEQIAKIYDVSSESLKLIEKTTSNQLL